MTIEQKMLAAEFRKSMLEARGSHNKALVKKAERQVRKYKKMLENK